MNKLKYIFYIICALVGFVQNVNAQASKKPIDGVIAVVGDHIILESDVDKFYFESKIKDADMSNVSRCQILGSMLENKMFAHHAVQDSLVVTDDEVNGVIDNQFDRMVEQVGSLDEVVKFYKKIL